MLRNSLGTRPRSHALGAIEAHTPARRALATAHEASPLRGLAARGLPTIIEAHGRYKMLPNVVSPQPGPGEQDLSANALVFFEVTARVLNPNVELGGLVTTSMKLRLKRRGLIPGFDQTIGVVQPPDKITLSGVEGPNGETVFGRVDVTPIAVGVGQVITASIDIADWKEGDYGCEFDLMWLNPDGAWRIIPDTDVEWQLGWVTLNKISTTPPALRGPELDGLPDLTFLTF